MNKNTKSVDYIQNDFTRRTAVAQPSAGSLKRGSRAMHSLLPVFAAGAMVLGVTAASALEAATYVWSPGPAGGIVHDDGNWNLTEANWTTDNGATKTTWVNGATSHASFGGGSGTSNPLVTVTLEDDVVLNALTMSSSYWPGVSVVGSGTLSFTGSEAYISNNNIYRNLTVNTQIVGTGGFVKINSGVVVLTANNTYTGNTNIRGNASANGGILQIGDGGTTGTLGNGNVNMVRASNQVGASTLRFNRSDAMTVNNRINVLDTTNGGIIEHSGIGKLTLSGQQTLTGNGNYKIHNAGGTDAADAQIDGKITGEGGLVKSGAGTLLVTGSTNDYSGETLVEEGTLLLANGLLGASDITVSGGAQFGFGKSAGADFSRFEVDALSLNLDNTDDARSGLLFSLGQADNDWLDIGSLAFDGDGSINIILKDTTWDGSESTLVDSYRLLLWDASSGLVSAEQFNLAGSDEHLLNGTLSVVGNELIYTVVVPEPSTWGLLAGAGVLCAALLRRRKRAGSSKTALSGCVLGLVVVAAASLPQPQLAAQALALNDAFLSAEGAALGGRAIGTEGAKWQSTANLDLVGQNKGYLQLRDVAQFMGTVELPAKWQSATVSAKVMAQSALEDKTNWIAVGIGNPQYRPIQFTWPSGVFLLFTSAGRYELIQNTSSSGLKVLKHGRAPQHWEGAWNAIELEYDRKAGSVTARVNGVAVADGIALAEPADLQPLQAGFSGYSQVPEVPGVSDFSLSVN